MTAEIDFGCRREITHLEAAIDIRWAKTSRRTAASRIRARPLKEAFQLFLQFLRRKRADEGGFRIPQLRGGFSHRFVIREGLTSLEDDHAGGIAAELIRSECVCDVDLFHEACLLRNRNGQIRYKDPPAFAGSCQ